ncbi:MAG: glycosyltransferase [Phycisphaerales bacterium]|nr:glycosyltransferase [Phycisphaerales bacterium]MDB5358534.1 glycosyltransferase [Phycisphaerales bacterium]
MVEGLTRRIVPWLLLLVYLPFVYSYGVRLRSLPYTDFPSFYGGARLTFVEKHSPYDMAALRALAERTEPAKFVEQKRKVYPYLYPPPSLLLFYPVGHLSVQDAKLAILVINHLCVLAVVYMLLVPIGGFRLGQVVGDLLPAFLVVYLLSFTGIILTIIEAQVNLVVLALMCLTWWGLKRDWPAWALALPIAVACLFKMYPILVLALLVIRRRTGAAALACGLLAAVGGIALLVLPHELWHDWVTNVLPSCGYFGSPMGVFPSTIAGNISVAGFMARLFLPLSLYIESGHMTLPAVFPHPGAGKALTMLILAMMVLVTAAVSYRASRVPALSPERRDRQLDLQFSAFLILTFLVAPVAWDHHLAYVAPAAIVVIRNMLLDGEQARRGRWALPAILAAACVIASPGAPARLPLPVAALAIFVSIRLYAVLVLWTFVLAELYRSSPVACSDSEFDETGEFCVAIE